MWCCEVNKIGRFVIAINNIQCNYYNYPLSERKYETKGDENSEGVFLLYIKSIVFLTIDIVLWFVDDFGQS